MHFIKYKQMISTHFAVQMYNHYKTLLDSETTFDWKRRKFRKDSLAHYGKVLIANNILIPQQLKQDGKRN